MAGSCFWSRGEVTVKCWVVEGWPFSSVIFFFSDDRNFHINFWECRFCFEKLLCWVLGYQKMKNIEQNYFWKFQKNVMKKHPKKDLNKILKIQSNEENSQNYFWEYRFWEWNHVVFCCLSVWTLGPPPKKKGQTIIDPKEVNKSRFLLGIFLVAGRFCPQFPYKFAGHQLSSEDVKIVASGSSNLDAIEG